MAATDFITGLLTRQYAASLYASRRRRTADHWRSYPALAERTVDEAAAVVTDAYHPDHNIVAAALLAAHRERPGQPTDTEIILLLVAARPLVLALDPGDRHLDSRASLWSAVARRLSALTPADIAESTVPFLVALLGRIRPDASKHPSEPALSLHADSDRLEAALQRAPDPAHDVPAVAIARSYLAAVRNDRAGADLTRYALYGRAAGVHQSRVSRQRHRLAHAIGYVA